MRDARSVAIDALVRIEGGAFANLVLPARLRASGLDPRDRAFVTHLVYGTVRMQRRIDLLLVPRCHQPFDRLEPRVRAALRVGVFQLLEQMAPHAAVGATVAATSPRARGLVNAVLRSVAGAGPDYPVPSDPGERWSYPDWIVDELAQQVDPAELADVLAAGNLPAATTLRPNRRVTSAADLEGELLAGGARVQRGSILPEALIVSGIGDPAELPAVAEGRATPQDEGSQLVVELLDPRPGERTLDVAAAPGGKATAAAERSVGGLVAALDVHPGRLRLVSDAASRLHLPEVHPVVADGRLPPVRMGTFERVLVDAPCSGLGVLRRRPEARWRVRADAVEALAALQRALLGAAAGAVAPGGRLVYAVCTLTRAETVGVARWALEHLDGFDPVVPPGPPWEPLEGGAILWPHRAGTDGMFLLALRRR